MLHFPVEQVHRLPGLFQRHFRDQVVPAESRGGWDRVAVCVDAIVVPGRGLQRPDAGFSPTRHPLPLDQCHTGDFSPVLMHTLWRWTFLGTGGLVDLDQKMIVDDSL